MWFYSTYVSNIRCCVDYERLWYSKLYCLAEPHCTYLFPFICLNYQSSVRLFSSYLQFNARSESISEKASFRRLLPKNRCLVAVEGYACILSWFVDKLNVCPLLHEYIIDLLVPLQVFLDVISWLFEAFPYKHCLCTRIREHVSYNALKYFLLNVCYIWELHLLVVTF